MNVARWRIWMYDAVAQAIGASTIDVNNNNNAQPIGASTIDVNNDNNAQPIGASTIDVNNNNNNSQPIGASTNDVNRVKGQSATDSPLNTGRTWHTQTHGHTDTRKQIDRQATDRQAGGQTDRQAGRQAGRQADRQTVHTCMILSGLYVERRERETLLDW